MTLDARYEPKATVELAFLGKVSETEIVADFAQWLTGAEAAQAAYEDGEIASVEEGVPNDYYIRNVNPQLRTLPVAGDVVVWLATSAAGPVSSVKVEMTDWLALYNDGVAWGEDQEAPSPEPPHFGYFGAGSETTPYWLVILDGEVIAVDQQYRP